MDNIKPYIIELKKFSDKGGNLSILDKEIPFDIKRLYWLYNVDGKIVRGGHAHLVTDRIIICLHKSLKAVLKDKFGQEHSFTLNEPNQALFYPKMYWIDLFCEEGAIMLAAASTSYEEDVYIRSYEEFIKTP